jgi:uncharacterized protein YhfF
MPYPVVNGLRSIEFGTKGEMRNRLNSMVLHGNKRATAGLLKEDYLDQGEPLETVGERLAMLDNEGNQIATLVITKVEELAFSEVPDAFALAEAEGDLNGDDFRVSHRRYWQSTGIEIFDETRVVTLYFELEK